ncbi:MAG: hypothetical protein M3P85_13780 [Actinomycetota bacterium]|nr:hypothetical protein [Actinomycetota bacterium]
MPSLNRREFLLAGAGLVFLAACGTSEDDEAGPIKVTEPSEEDVPEAAGPSPVNLVVASYVHVAGSDQRLTLAFLNEEGTGPVKPEGPVQITIDGEEVDSELHADGSLELPYLLVRHRFDEPGFATVNATYQGTKAKAAVEVTDPAKAKAPLVGQPLLSVPTPTAADARGVDPICTRDPMCPLHDVSLDAALAENRPLAVLLATPARCQSRLCGPVLDNLLAHRDAFADRVRFVHVEIYASRTGTELAPAVKAYGLSQEPFLFLVGADGVIRERIDNAFDRTEAGQALERLVAS